MESVRLRLGVLLLCCFVFAGCRADDYGPDGYDGYDARPQRGGLVDVDVRETGFGNKHVGVHVPVFYKMDLDKDAVGMRKGLGINVLEGLVKVRVKKDPYKIKDNVFVSVAGVPLWYQRRR